MIDANNMLLRVRKLTPEEAARIIGEMGTVLNTMSVQLREQGYDIGHSAEATTLHFRLIQAWNHLYNARPMMKALAHQQVDVDAPIWQGDEPPLDQPPSPV